jgi:hypothetical protein
MARRSPARPRIGVRLLLAVLGPLLLVGGLATCGTPAPTPRSAGTDATTGRLSDTAADTAIRAGAPTSALAALADVPVKGRAPRTGYQRDQFGPAWADTDRNGCDTRDDVLARDLTGETFKAGTHGCVVLTGTLADPYSGRTLTFRRGPTTSEAVQIDHVVALSDAWQKGAQAWDVARRTAFANDPLNLLAVDGPLNTQKSDGDAATWLPPNRAYRCAYVARQIAVKLRYGLWMTRAERTAAATVLSGCRNESLPTAAASPGAGSVGLASPSTVPPPTRASSPESSPESTSTSGIGPAPGSAAGVSYANCAAVRAAHAAPIRAGDPGWDPKFDGNHDGVGCE